MACKKCTDCECRKPATPDPDPNCGLCHGKGVIKDQFGFMTCVCVKYSGGPRSG